ncbi:MAG: ion transporter [Acidobacteriota bacterium]|nr:ion transporter [Acidobacteriota bacterium]
MKKSAAQTPETPVLKRLHEIIFESDTRAGRIFDLVLLWLIVASVVVVTLESVRHYREDYGEAFYYIEWIFTILFTVEYVLRLVSVRRPLNYAFSFFGIIDLLSIIPGFLSLLLPGTHYLLVVRILRLLRIFRILKLAEYVSEARVITSALAASKRKISVFLLAVLAIVVVVGSLMYVIEGEENGFLDIPTGIYWAIVTLTTVGYGDLSPKTALGKTLASIVMILGYAIIAVPTGIVTAELTRSGRKNPTRACPECGASDHDDDAGFCKICGGGL